MNFVGGSLKLKGVASLAQLTKKVAKKPIDDKKAKKEKKHKKDKKKHKKRSSSSSSSESERGDKKHRGKDGKAVVQDET